MLGCNTSGFPSITSYAEAREHFDSVKPWDSKYNGRNERPIGIRAVHHNDGYKFKAMRMVNSESIAFRLFNTDCVIWHLDNTVTVHGWPSVSTSRFIDTLTPEGVRHSFRTTTEDGRRVDQSDPVLYLMPVVEHVSPPNEWRDDEYRWTGPDWKGGIVIRCGHPIHLNYNAKAKHWVPTEPEMLTPFHTYTLDRKLARQVSRDYRLADFQRGLAAFIALTGIKEQRGGRQYDVALALKDGDMQAAVKLVPVGTSTTRSYGQDYGGPGKINPGFLHSLRNWIYDHEGVIQRTEQRILTPAQHARYIADSKRFDA